MKLFNWFATAVVLLAVPALASAADGYVTANVTLRAGPDVDYPRIGIIPAGAPVAIQGCTAGWVWCDVVVYGNRGWVAADFIQYDYANRRVFLPAYGARIGIPIVTFVISNYWGSYYRDRPFYRNRTHWYAQPVRNRPPPRQVRRPAQRPVRDYSPRSGSRPSPAYQGNTHRPTAPGNRSGQAAPPRDNLRRASGEHAPTTSHKASQPHKPKKSDDRRGH